MGKTEAQEFYDPVGGETQGYVTTTDAKDAIGLMYDELADRATLGNLLTDPIASCTTTDGWIDWSGNASLSVLNNLIQVNIAAGGGAVGTSGKLSKVTPGNAYTASAELLATNQTPSTRLRILWRDAAGSGTGPSPESPLEPMPYPNSKRLTVTGVAPAGAVSAELYVSTPDVGTAIGYRIDNAGLWAGAGGEWAMPGTPITGLGQRNNNGIMELWSGTAWKPMAATASPDLTGVPTTPTMSIDNSTTAIASTAFVTNQAASATSPMDGVATVGTSKRYSRQDHIHPSDTSRADVYKIGNRLTDSQADCTSTAGLQANFCAATVSTEWADQGTTCIRLASNAAYTFLSYETSTAPANYIPVLNNMPLTVRSVVRLADDSSAQPSASARAEVKWYDAGKVAISTSYGTLVPMTGTTPLTLQETFVSPSNAAYASMKFLSLSGITADQTARALIDSMGFWIGAGGDWAMPGTPITGLGTRITRPNVDDRLVEQYNPAANSGAGGWSVVDYHSGWRSLTSLLQNGWAEILPSYPGISISRHKDTVNITGYLHGSAATSANVIPALTTGWLVTPRALVTGMVTNTSGTATGPTVITNGSQLQILGTNIRVNNIGFSLTYTTSDPIPTSLPGTLVTAAPA